MFHVKQLRCSTWNIALIICDFKHKYKTVNLISFNWSIFVRNMAQASVPWSGGPVARFALSDLWAGDYDPIAGGPCAISPGHVPQLADHGSGSRPTLNGSGLTFTGWGSGIMAARPTAKGQRPADRGQ